MDKIDVTQADRDLRDKLESVAYAANDGGAFISDDALELIASHRIATRTDATPVAVIGKDWRLLWASPEPLARIVEQTGIKIGSLLYAEPDLNAERMRAVLQAIEKEGMKNHATRCAPWWEAVRAILQEQADAK